jgi:hypothetical protein
VQIQHQSAKLAKMFEKAVLWCHKIEFFSWSSVDFYLYQFDGFVVNSVKISPFRNVLPDKFVRMLDISFLP